MSELSNLVRTARLRLLKMHYERRVGHIGGNLSALDMLMVLRHRILQRDDVFVLSKGHAAGALYVTLWSAGRLTDDELCQFHAENTKLSAHPPPRWLPEIPFATGSLGHGLPLAIGLALGKALQRQPGRVFCMLSDGELQEGSTWEALIFLKRRRLAPLTILIDANGLQGFGTTCEVTGLELNVAKFREFDIEAEEIDGHDLDAIQWACAKASDGPRVVIARTHKGHGVSFMEDRMEWHYLPMSPEQYQQAMDEVQRANYPDSRRRRSAAQQRPACESQVEEYVTGYPLGAFPARALDRT
jgi:transketolase